MLKISLKSILYSNFIYILGLLSLSLGFVNVNGYSLSIANFLVLFLFFNFLNTNKITVFLIYFSLIFYIIGIAIFFLGSLDLFEYIKSFILTSIMLLVFISSLFYPLKLPNLSIKLIISYVGVIVVLFEIIQIAEYMILGTSNSWFLLDKFSISTATDVGRFQAVNFLSFIRPISLYHEPSFLGIVLLILLICANEVKIHRFFVYMFYVGILASLSTTSLVFLVFYILFNNVKKVKNALVLLFVIFILVFLLDNETFDAIFRFSEIFNAGTSGNERLIGPYDYLVNQIFVKHHYFGIPLGQSELVFNNSFYLLFLYFGLFTPIILMALVIYIFVIFKFRAINYIIALFSLLFLNGAIFSLEATLLLYFLNLTFFTSRNANFIKI